MANAVRIMAIAFVALLAVARFGEPPARAAGPFDDALVQPPSIAQPQRGSLAGLSAPEKEGETGTTNA